MEQRQTWQGVLQNLESTYNEDIKSDTYKNIYVKKIKK